VYVGTVIGVGNAGGVGVTEEVGAGSGGKELTSTAIVVEGALADTCSEITSGVRESLDPVVAEGEQPYDKLTATAIDLSLKRSCIKLPR